MKKILLVSAIFIFTCGYGQTFEIAQGQSMCMIGKGKGQDATINPFIDDDYSFAMVENIGTEDFKIRIQENNNVIRQILIKSREKFKLKLFKGNELYFDSITIPKSVARISYSEK